MVLWRHPYNSRNLRVLRVMQAAKKGIFLRRTNKHDVCTMHVCVIVFRRRGKPYSIQYVISYVVSKIRYRKSAASCANAKPCAQWKPKTIVPWGVAGGPLPVTTTSSPTTSSRWVFFLRAAARAARGEHEHSHCWTKTNKQTNHDKVGACWTKNSSCGKSIQQGRRQEGDATNPTVTAHTRHPESYEGWKNWIVTPPTRRLRFVLINSFDRFYMLPRPLLAVPADRRHRFAV